MSNEIAILPHEEQAILQMCIEGIIKGYSQDIIVEEMLKLYSDRTDEEYIIKAIRKGMSIIKEETLTDIEKIIPLHIELYEKIYEELNRLRFVPGKLKALRQKEKLVGLHKTDNTIEIHNTVDVEVEVGESLYDLGKLDERELKRLTELSTKIEGKNDTGQRT